MISTSGFRVSNLPRYTPVDPSLVAFNPGAILGGVNQSLSTGALWEKVKADRALQEELAATRAARIAAENAKATLTTARSGKELDLLDRETAARLNKLIYEGKSFEDLTSLLPDKSAADRATYQATTALAPIRAGAEAAKTAADLSLLGVRTNAERARANRGIKLDTFMADNDIDTSKEGLSLVDQLERFRTGQEEKGLKRAALEAETEYKLALAQKALAEASYAENGKQNKDYVELNSHLNNHKRLREAIVQDPAKPGSPMLLSKYRALYGTDKKPKTVKSGIFGLYGSAVPRNAEADALLEQEDALMSRISELTSKMTKKPTGKDEPQESAGLSVGKVVDGFRYLGGNPNDKNSWEPVK